MVKPAAKTTRATVKLASLLPNPRNNRVHEAEQIAMLKASIRRFGQPRPVLARRQNRMLITGHGIYQAMAELGLIEIDVIFWDVDQQTADEFLLADNRLAELSSADPERTRALLEGVPEDAYEALGFSALDIKALLDEGGASLTVREVVTGDVSDQFWISVRGPLAKQAATLKRLQQLMSEFPEVEVELGTIALEA
jgi:ParB-like chromosome segregation protein Spo0J